MISLHITLLLIGLGHSSKQSTSTTTEAEEERIILQVKLAKETRCASIAQIENYKVKEFNRDVLLWAIISYSICRYNKCCKRFLKLFSCCRGGIADGQDGHDNGHDIHLKCVLACCSGTVADNDIADRTKREGGCAEPEQ